MAGCVPESIRTLQRLAAPRGSTRLHAVASRSRGGGAQEDLASSGSCSCSPCCLRGPAAPTNTLIPVVRGEKSLDPEEDRGAAGPESRWTASYKTRVLLDQSPARPRLAGPESCWSRVLLDQSPAGPESCWSRVLLDPSPAGPESCWTRVLLVQSPAGPESCWSRVLLDPSPRRPSPHQPPHKTHGAIVFPVSRAKERQRGVETRRKGFMISPVI
ncbi:hypothetical protein EYF80_060037 [Liparis tanakae]|uniref:Uncharacterized protein n=1 Tax=Liparis tanakae TaxID=230148 RepID=A0A4Z2EMW7_9TELE|nr:hypothetical protein EYF80_060037 [Liparis tanakae]